MSQQLTKLFADPRFDGMPEKIYEAGESDDLTELVAQADEADPPIEEKAKEDELIETIAACPIAPTTPIEPAHR